MLMFEINKRTVPNKIIRVGKNTKINKRTCTTIPYFRVMFYVFQVSDSLFSCFKIILFEVRPRYNLASYLTKPNEMQFSTMSFSASILRFCQASAGAM